MPVGNNSNGFARSFVAAENLAATIRGRSVTTATLHLRQMNIAGHNRNVNVGIYRTLCPTAGQTTSFTEMTWNTRTLSTTTPITTQTLSAASWTYEFNVTSWARGVANSDFTNRGLTIRAVEDTRSQIMEFYGSHDIHTTRRPRLVVTTLNPPTAPTSITLSDPFWAPGQPLPLLRWSGITSTRPVTRIEYRIAHALICPIDGTHSLGNIIKPFTESPHLTPAQGVSGFSLPITNFAQGCYRIAVRAVDDTGARGLPLTLSLHVDRTAPT